MEYTVAGPCLAAEPACIGICTAECIYWKLPACAGDAEPGARVNSDACIACDDCTRVCPRQAFWL